MDMTSCFFISFISFSFAFAFPLFDLRDDHGTSTHVVPSSISDGVGKGKEDGLLRIIERRGVFSGTGCARTWVNLGRRVGSCLMQWWHQRAAMNRGGISGALEGTRVCLEGLEDLPLLPLRSLLPLWHFALCTLLFLFGSLALWHFGLALIGGEIKENQPRCNRDSQSEGPMAGHLQAFMTFFYQILSGDAVGLCSDSILCWSDSIAQNASGLSRRRVVVC